jgi:hypothetical protein
MPAARIAAGWVLTSQAPPVDPNAIQVGEYEPPPTDAVAPTIFHPVGKTQIDVAAVAHTGTGYATTEVDEECRAIYLGRAQKAFTGAEVVVDVLTAVVAPSWCEAAIMKSSGSPVLCDGPSAMTTLKAVDATAAWSVVGPVSQSFGNVTIARGEHIWFAWACKRKDQADPLPEFRAFLPDYILSGLSVYLGATRPSTMAAGTNFNRLGNTIRTVDSVVGCS